MPRPLFSTKTKLVLAELDRTFPLDRAALEEMAAKKVIVPLGKRFKTTAPNITIAERFRRLFRNRRLYAIPFKDIRGSSGGLAGLTLHNRSLFTVAAGQRQFVFKGTGSQGEHSYRGALGDYAEHRFYGGARVQTIRWAVDTLQELEHAYKAANRDEVVRWAAKEHGITELPVIKHVAVFRPLQILTGKQGTKLRRLPITKQSMKALGLGEFYGDQRVQVYSAVQPKRIENFETTSDFLADAKNIAKKTGEDIRRVVLKRFLARSLLFLHIAHSRRIVLSSPSGSIIGYTNTGPFEFFDFDVAEKIRDRKEFSKRAETDYEKLAILASGLALGLKGPPFSFKNISRIEAASLKFDTPPNGKELNERLERIADHFFPKND